MDLPWGWSSVLRQSHARYFWLLAGTLRLISYRRQFFHKIHNLFDSREKQSELKVAGAEGSFAPAYLEGLAFHTASVSGEPCERTPLSVKIPSVAASICARGKIIVSLKRLSHSMVMNSSLASRKISTR